MSSCRPRAAGSATAEKTPPGTRTGTERPVTREVSDLGPLRAWKDALGKSVRVFVNFLEILLVDVRVGV